jgi:hypothetical protein
VRVGLTDFSWPLDPALAEGRDETTLARTLYSTPLRTDPETGAVVPGLCRAWNASADFREWRFTCNSASSIAAALRRLRRLSDAPAHWLFADTQRIAASGSTLVVRLKHPWRRFPYALTVVGTAPRFVAGPFRLVSGSDKRVVVRRPGLTVDFRKVGARTAVRDFERGELDEAQVPLGDISSLRDRFGGVVHARTLLALDLVGFDRFDRRLRHVYWETANRGDYAELVAEDQQAAAYGLLASSEKPKAREFRDARDAIESLSRVAVRIEVPDDPVLRYGARLLYAQWRDLGLGPQLVTPPARADAVFQRVFAAYPQEEALPAELDPHPEVLAATQQHGELARINRELRAGGRIVPIAWVVDARLVSPRLEGWFEDALGNVDYAAVRSPASSPRP